MKNKEPGQARGAAQATKLRRLAPWAQRCVERVVKESGKSGLSRDQVVAAVIEAAEIGGEANLPVVELAADALSALRSTAKLVSRDHRWFEPSTLGLRRGRLERTGARFFRVRDLQAPETQFYQVDPKDLEGARQGDTVLFLPIRAVSAGASRSRRSTAREQDRRSAGSARVKDVVRSSTRTWVGLLQSTRYGMEFLPFDHRLRFDARELDLRRVERQSVLAQHDLEEGLYVSLLVDSAKTSRIDRRPARGSRGERRSRSGGPGSAAQTRRASLGRVIGSPSQPNIETDVVAAHFELPDVWPEEALAAEREWLAAEGKNKTLSAEHGREDLRRLTTFTIDGATARDFDDALSIETTKSGTRLWVHIADVSHFVRPGKPIDLEAQRRGTSVYFADRALHMLPKGLSENLCSLRPDCDRYALSVAMTFDQGGVRTGSRVVTSIIRSDARLTYSEVDRHFEEGTSLESPSVAAALSHARDLANALLARREERGAFEIEQDVGAFSIGKDGAPKAYRSTPRLFAHRLIEEFMIQANVAVADIAAERLSRWPSNDMEDPPTFLYRQHDRPKPVALEELVEQVTALGIEVPSGGIENVGDLAALLDSVGDRGVRGFVESLLLRSLKRAIYAPNVAQHFALGLEAYCHFTSPIRRYPDLVDHRCMKVVLFGDAQHRPTGGSYLGEQELAEKMSELEQRAERAEREQFRWRMVRWLKAREGDLFSVTVTSVQPFGLFVVLDGFGIDGLIPFEEVPGGEVEVVTEGLEVSVRGDGFGSGMVFRLGDSLSAVLLRADQSRRQLMLSLEPSDGATGSNGSARRRGRRQRPTGNGPGPRRNREASRKGEGGRTRSRRSSRSNRR